MPPEEIVGRVMVEKFSRHRVLVLESEGDYVLVKCLQCEGSAPSFAISRRRLSPVEGKDSIVVSAEFIRIAKSDHARPEPGPRAILAEIEARGVLSELFAAIPRGARLIYEAPFTLAEEDE